MSQRVVPSSDFPHAELRQSGRRAVGSLALITLINNGLSFAVGVLLADYVGAGQVADTYFMAINTGTIFTKLLIAGSLSSVFLPVFVHHLAVNRERAWQIAANHFAIVALAGGGLAFVLVLAAPVVARLVAPGFDPPQLATLTSLLRLLLPAQAFVLMCSFFTALLNGLQRFSLPALAALAPSIGLVLGLVLGFDRFGVFGIVHGLIAGILVQGVVTFQAVRRAGLTLRLLPDLRDPAVLEFGRLMVPVVLSGLVVQLGMVMFNRLASLQEPGAVSVLAYGERVLFLVQSLVAVSIGTVMTPRITSGVASGDWDEVNRLIARAVRGTLVVVVPISVGLVLTSDYLVQLLLVRGAFDPGMSSLASVVVAVYSAGLIGHGVGSIFVRLPLALKRTTLYAGVRIGAQLLYIALMLWLSREWGTVGLAVAVEVMPLVIAAGFLYGLRPQLPRLWRSVLNPGVGKVVVAGVAMAMGTAVWLEMCLRWIEGSSPVLYLAMIVSAAAVGGVIYLAAARIQKVEELDVLGTLWTAYTRQRA